MMPTMQQKDARLYLVSASNCQRWPQNVAANEEVIVQKRLQLACGHRQFHPQALHCIELSGLTDRHLGEVGVNAPVAGFVHVGQRRAPNRFAEPHVIQLRGLGRQRKLSSAKMPFQPRAQLRRLADLQGGHDNGFAARPCSERPGRSRRLLSSSHWTLSWRGQSGANSSRRPGPTSAPYEFLESIKKEGPKINFDYKRKYVALMFLPEGSDLLKIAGACRYTGKFSNNLLDNYRI